MQVTPLMYLIVCPLIFLGGFIDSIAGGGGLITLPAYYLAGLPPALAAGTNKLSAVAGTAVATGKYVSKGLVEWKQGLVSLLGAVPGAAFGSLLLTLIPAAYAKLGVVIALPMVAALVLRNRTLTPKRSLMTEKWALPACFAIGLVIGVYDGLIGPGTGTFMIMAFTMALSMDLLTASGCAKIANLCSNVASAVLFIISGKVWWLLALPAAACNMLGAYCGARYAMKGGSKRVRGMIFVVLGLLFIKMGYELLF